MKPIYCTYIWRPTWPSPKSQPGHSTYFQKVHVHVVTSLSSLPFSFYQEVIRAHSGRVVGRCVARRESVCLSVGSIDTHREVLLTIDVIMPNDTTRQSSRKRAGRGNRKSASSTECNSRPPRGCGLQESVRHEVRSLLDRARRPRREDYLFERLWEHHHLASTGSSTLLVNGTARRKTNVVVLRAGRRSMGAGGSVDLSSLSRHCSEGPLVAQEAGGLVPEWTSHVHN